MECTVKSLRSRKVAVSAQQVPLGGSVPSVIDVRSECRRSAAQSVPASHTPSRGVEERLELLSLQEQLALERAECEKQEDERQIALERQRLEMERQQKELERQEREVERQRRIVELREKVISKDFEAKRKSLSGSRNTSKASSIFSAEYTRAELKKRDWPFIFHQLLCFIIPESDVLWGNIFLRQM